jgi:hypothetical protein
MNDDIGRRRSARRPWPRRAGFLAAMANLALLAAACGGSSSPATGGSTQYQKELAYSQCMRSHGVPNFPDPDSQGNLPLLQEGRNGVSPQAVQSAQNACRHLQTSGGPGTPQQQQQAKLTQALNFARCMRAHGVPNFPDPTTAGNGGMGFNLSGVDTQSPQYQSANRACQSQSGKGQSPAGGKS